MKIKFDITNIYDEISGQLCSYISERKIWNTPFLVTLISANLYDKHWYRKGEKLYEKTSKHIISSSNIERHATKQMAFVLPKQSIGGENVG